MKWSSIKYAEGRKNAFLAESEDDLQLPDPEEVKKRHEQMERTLDRLTRNVRSLRERILSLLDRLPKDKKEGKKPEKDDSDNQEKESPDDQQP